jgi:hypothetical protein
VRNAAADGNTATVCPSDLSSLRIESLKD